MDGTNARILKIWALGLIASTTIPASEHIEDYINEEDGLK